MTEIQNEALGTSFDDFLEENGILEEVTEAAAKRVLAMSFDAEIKKLSSLTSRKSGD